MAASTMAPEDSKVEKGPLNTEKVIEKQPNDAVITESNYSTQESGVIGSQSIKDVEKQRRGHATDVGDHAVCDEERIDWDEPDDPEKPMNWPTGKKARNIIIICYVTFLTFERHSLLSFSKC